MKRPYQKLVDALEAFDDTNRETITYPDYSTVVGVSEGDDFLVVASATSMEPEKPVQAVLIPTDNLDTLHVLRETVDRMLARLERDKA